jgi:hypothetical protein
LIDSFVRIVVSNSSLTFSQKKNTKNRFASLSIASHQQSCQPHFTKRNNVHNTAKTKTMKINTKHDFYRRSQYYRNSTSSHMLDEQQQTHGLIDTPRETSMTRLPDDDKDYDLDSTDTTDPIWYSSDEGTDEEGDDSSCIIISHEALSSANEAVGYDEESGYDAKPSQKAYSSTKVRSSRRVRFSDAPPDVCNYEKPGIDCYNKLYYTGHEMQNMRLEYCMEKAEMMTSLFTVGHEDLWSEDEDSDWRLYSV